MRRGSFVLVVAVTGMASSCPSTKRNTVGSLGLLVPPPEATMIDDREPGFTLKLSDGAPEPGPTAHVALAKAIPLSDADAQKVLGRLPKLEEKPGDRADFVLRDRSLPPPRPGKTVDQAFPPAPTPKAPPDPAAAGPLAVLRHQPDGDMSLAPNLSVTFSQPMVPVTSLAELGARDVPVKLSPEPPGKWRWVGTKTLLFEPAGRFPMATTYSVEVPAGTRSQAGGALAKAERFGFRTPAPRLVDAFPKSGPARREPLLFFVFDQKIDPSAVLATIAVTGGGRAASVRLATAAEIEQDEAIRKLAKNAEPGRFLAFRPTAPLPPDAAITVKIGPGTPSAEGSLTTTKVQEVTFRTYGALKVTSSRCGWGEECRPFMPFQIELSNPVDAKRFVREMVRVEPAIPEMRVQAYDRWLTISGRTRGRTRYQVTLAPALPDAFGQTLGEDTTLSFKVGRAEPLFHATGGPFVVLDPSAAPAFSVYSVNVKAVELTVYAVGPTQVATFRERLRRTYEGAGFTPLGDRLISTQVPLKGAEDELTETRLDLAAAFPQKHGQVVVTATPVPRPRGAQAVVAWVQKTEIGLDAFADAGELTAFASRLADGAPLADVEISLGDTRVRTGANGLATLPLEHGGPVLVARKGADLAILPYDPSAWGGDAAWKKRATADLLRWHVFDDRGMYRPGEEVKVKGWLRRFGSGEGGDVMGLDGAVPEITWLLRDSVGNEIKKGTVRPNALGGFDFAMTLPPTMNLGYAVLQLEARSTLGGKEHAHPLQVQEFRRPEFEVTTTAPEGPHLVGGHAVIKAEARYYAGGGLANTDVTWRVTTRPGTFSPPNRDEWVFGKFVPWWDVGPILHRVLPEGQKSETFAARTDAAGTHHLRIDFQGANPPRPTNVIAEATVMDVNRQAWAASSNLLVHPADVYVGLKSERAFVNAGEPLRVDAIVTDLDGNLVSGRKVELVVERMDWEQVAGEWKTLAKDPQPCALTSAGGPGRCEITPRAGGLHRVIARVLDARGRKNESELTVWVAGGKEPPRREVAQEQLTLVPDKKEYRAGDTAEVLVIAPFGGGEGVVTLRRSGIVRVERFKMQGSSHTVKVKIEEAWTPNVHVQVNLVGAAPRSDDTGSIDEKLPKRPAFAKGAIDLSIPPARRALAVAVQPRDARLEPGGQTRVAVTVKDAAGHPVAGSEVALVVVNEAVLSLSGYRLADPLEVFYARREPGGEDRHLREAILLAHPADARASGEEEQKRKSDRFQGPGGGGGGFGPGAPPPAAAPAEASETSGMLANARALRQGEAPGPAIQLRTDFSALAFFGASLPTDARGQAEVKVKLPDSLTRYRVMAVAAARTNEFGKGESTITARLPLMVRPSAPRFLNFGDEVELPVVVQNQTDAPLQVDVAVKALGARLTAGAGRRLTVAANDRVEVRFPLAARQAGRARFQVGAAAERWADAASFELPVWTPATTEAFATYGTVDEAGAIAQPVAPPRGVAREVGGLEITTSSTAVQALTDAVLYLVAYPFECSEQLASRVLSVAALKDVLAAFRADGLPPPPELIAAVGRDVARLARLQNDDGGFAFWRRGDESWPYLSIHVANALVQAKAKGFDVPAPVLSRSLTYLREVERHIPAWYGKEERTTLIAYALYVRRRLGNADPARARRLLAERGVEKTSFEALAWILDVIHDDSGSRREREEILHHLGNRVSETAGAAHFTVSYGDGAHLLLHSDRRADALVLDALIQATPQSDLIPKLVTGLLAHRTAGRWGNTQENVFILLALDRYFGTYEKVTPDFVARAWLGERYAGEHAFRGRTSERHHVWVPMADLGDRPAALILAKEGKGRLYYRIGMQYAPVDLKAPPYDAGFTVERRYEGADDARDVRRDADGTWRVRAGTRVRVTLTMVAPARRHHVALVDPLPAGLEALNPALKVTGAVPPGPDPTAAVSGGPGLGGPGLGGHWWIWLRPWYDHQNLRDERVEAFAALLWEGVWTYSYVARATTPGTFVVPPPKAEEMYSPETFGRGAGDRMIVE